MTGTPVCKMFSHYDGWCYSYLRHYLKVKDELGLWYPLDRKLSVLKGRSGQGSNADNENALASFP